MMISGREARGRLEAAGFSSRHARSALDCGLAGLPLRTRAAHLYESARVDDLAARPQIGWPVVFEACPDGIFVARRELDMTRPGPEVVEAASCGWTEMDPWAWLTISFQIKRDGALPFVATVAGVVVVGGDLVGRRPGGLRLARPGAWFDQIRGRRFVTGPGRPWVLIESDRPWRPAS
jgi:hypothetical protein